MISPTPFAPLSGAVRAKAREISERINIRRRRKKVTPGKPDGDT
jgi:hypothetical protein